MDGSPSVAPDTVSTEATDFIAVMGQTGVGKSTFINTVTESSQQLEVGHGLESCTQAVQLSEPLQFQGRNVVFIDTPGFDDSDADRSDADILRMIADHLVEAKQRLAGVVYVKDISQVKMTGSACNNLHLFKKICGEDSLRNVAIVTTKWGRVPEEEGKERQRNLEINDKYFGGMIKAGAVPFCYDGTPASAHSILEHIFTKQPTELNIQREMVVEKKELADTEAAQELHKQLDAKSGRIETLLARLDREAKESEIAYQGAQAEIEKYKIDLERLEKEKQKLKHRYKLWGTAAQVTAGAILMAAGIPAATVL
ncbi:P-loop containing nucleoside triphosphate hydrolase protein [Coprinellus micaceus]|uniref:P-loop containing nucleoside triphosphate hydrolase protein n=1 Tax=Coprinellus micaceus TaxID=71717 RepID=A0A4Y7SLC9_COPMI|nr:P-loop containing nucleoside triphosphate hydrolase protein [Coprinellus micaceus]